jgi:hypothetical protein
MKKCLTFVWLNFGIEMGWEGAYCWTFLFRADFKQKKGQMLRRKICVTSAKMHLCCICAKNVQ